MMSDILDAAIAQNPIDFKAKFDAALQEAVLGKCAELQTALVEAFGKKDDEDDKEDKDKDESDKKDESEKKDDESEDEDEDDDSKKSNLTERTLSFEVGNPSSASKQLRSKGIAAASEPGDGKVVKVKVASPDDGRKVAAWLADQGWSEKDIKQKYPELSRLSKQKG